MQYFDKKIAKIGNSNGIIIDNIISYVTGFEAGDEIELRCQKNKMTIVKKQKED